VRKIDRHGDNLDGDGRNTIQQIYNNIKTNVAVSEVYLVPASLDPDKIDPVTGKPEVPILMLDKAIFGDASSAPEEEPVDPNLPEQVEIYEYRLLKQQFEYLRANYPRAAAIKDIAAPMISGRECITCDNDDYNTTHADADRTGIVLSVPFYDMKGELAGSVSAIIRTVKLRELLPDTDAALLNLQYGYTVPAKLDGQQNVSKNSVQTGEPDPAIIFSEVLPLEAHDPQSQWKIWIGRSDGEFWSGAEAQGVRNFARASSGVLLLAVAIAIAIVLLIKRNAGVAALHQAALAREEAIRQKDAERQALAREEAARESQENRRNDMLKLASRFEASIGAVSRIVAEESERLKQVAQLLTDSAGETQQQAAAAAKVSNAAAANAATVSVSAGQFSYSIKEIGEQARQSAEIAGRAVNEAKTTHGQVKTLAEAASVIGSIIGLIEEIASKTNFLALNATIESARAGVAGKSFAVVAAEVKQLADQTAEATGQISAQITAIQSSTGTATSAIDNISRVITAMNQIASVIETSVHQQSGATETIATSIRDVYDGTTEVSRTISEVEKSAIRSHTAASNALLSASELSQQADAMMNDVTAFLQSVRTA
jgi:methyl-accepting chemotaxis protein